MLLAEMEHRIRNLFSLANGVVNLSVPSAGTPKELAAIVQDRLSALARAHALTLPKSPTSGEGLHATTLQTLLQTIITPYEKPGNGRLSVTGPDIPISPSLATDFALVLHELATNAAKYGALSIPTGSVHVACADGNGVFSLTWTERGGPRIEREPTNRGFGSQLAQATIVNRLNGDLSRDWNPDGLTVRLSVSRSRLVE